MVLGLVTDTRMALNSEPSHLYVATKVSETPHVKS